jgi:hypothetical protein
MSLKYGFCGFNAGLGDHIMVSSFPENFYRNTNKKIIDMTKSWIFDHNPFVIRNEDADIILNHLDTQIDIINKKQRQDWKSDSEELCNNFGLKQCFLRLPRLYRFEDSKTDKNLIVVHTTGKTVGSMSDEIIKQIEYNYSDYYIVQIGLDTDKPTNFHKALNLTPWETAELISKATTYIGVNSGFYHMANCYPKVRKKIIINELYENQLIKFQPKKNSLGTEWYDYNIEIYNNYIYDIGCTLSYRKI